MMGTQDGNLGPCDLWPLPTVPPWRYHQKLRSSRNWTSVIPSEPGPCARGSCFKEFHSVLGHLDYKTRKLEAGYRQLHTASCKGGLHLPLHSGLSGHTASWQEAGPRGLVTVTVTL